MSVCAGFDMFNNGMPGSMLSVPTLLHCYYLNSRRACYHEIRLLTCRPLLCARPVLPQVRIVMSGNAA